jgi:acetyl esterase/lipase
LPLSVALWPDGAPGEPVGKQETDLPPRGDGVERITHVGKPTLTWFEVDKSQGPSPAVLVCPGGGYRALAFDKEGTEIAEWLRSIGIAAAVLKYRVPQNREGAFQDAQRAMGLLRRRAKQWNIDPKRVGVIGFSAGGHLAARLSTDYAKRAYANVDEADRFSCRPDFTVLVYPAYLSKKEEPRELVDEVVVTDQTPPAFLVQTQDDRAYVDSSIAYYLALKKAGVTAELHLFPDGGHGYGLRRSKRPVSGWPRLCEAWLRDRGVIASVTDKPSEKGRK